MLNVFFLAVGFTRACLNAVGKVPVRRDVLMMTEGEDGSLSSRYGWFEILRVWSETWLLIDLVLFVKKVSKSSAV